MIQVKQDFSKVKSADLILQEPLF